MVKNAVVSSKGQVTIPAEVRAALRLSQGDVVSFEVLEDGRVVLRPVQAVQSPFAAFAGSLSKGEGKTARQIVEELREARGW